MRTIIRPIRLIRLTRRITIRRRAAKMDTAITVSRFSRLFMFSAQAQSEQEYMRA